MSHEPEDHFDGRTRSARPDPATDGFPAQPNEQPDAGNTPANVPGSNVPGSAAQSARYRAAYAANYMDESPELLRWRADSLLDEMMLGGLDVSAADTSSAPARPVPAQEARRADEWRPAQPATSPNRPPADYFEPDYEHSHRRADEPSAAGQPPSEQRAAGAARHGPVEEDAYHAARRDGREGAAREAAYRAEERVDDSRSSLRSEERYAPAVESARGDYAPATERRDYATSPQRSEYATSTERSEYATSPERSEYAASPREQFQLDEIGVRPPRLEPNKAMPEATPRPLESVRSGEAPGEAAGNSRGDRLYGLEQKYEQLRREQESTVRPMPPKTPTAGTTPESDESDPWPDPGQKWLEHDFGATPEPEIEPAPVDYGSYRAPRYEEPESAVRHDPAGFVNAMSVSGGKKRRSTLLPRMSEVSPDALQQEITRLHAELADLLPVGHEAAERARHLLDKAYSILQSDPMRSAEVEYYMQQVRTIVQRQSQARDWSNHYRDRLRVYLLSWASFAAVVLMGCFVFQVEIAAWLVNMGLDPAGIMVRHFGAWLGTGVAGALGGALGALYTMRQHASNSQYNFFDRKYGLRGLILPVIGLLIGWIGYAIFGLLFGLFHINPSANLVAAAVPAIAAFAFGFSQESIYGTRG